MSVIHMETIAYKYLPNLSPFHTLYVHVYTHPIFYDFCNTISIYGQIKVEYYTPTYIYIRDTLGLSSCHYGIMRTPP